MYAVAMRIIGRSVNEWNEAFIFFGHWTWKANTLIPGIRTPLELLRFCLPQLGSTVIVVHEHRTSKLCNFGAQTIINEDRRTDISLSNFVANPSAPKIRTFTRDRNQPLDRNHQNHSPMNWNRHSNALRPFIA